MPIGRQTSPNSRIWPSGGVHLWPSGGTSPADAHPRGHLVYAARGVLSVHTERGTSIVPANRVAWTPAGFTHRHRAHGHTDMRIVFLPPSLARLVPDHPAVFTAPDLAREVLLALTGPREYDRAASARLRRVLVDELRDGPRAAAPAAGTPGRPAARAWPGCCTRTRATTRHWRSSGRGSGPAPARSAGCSTTNSA